MFLVPITDFWSPHGIGATARKPILCRLSITHKSRIGTGSMKGKRSQPGLRFPFLRTGHPGLVRRSWPQPDVWERQELPWPLELASALGPTAVC